MTGIEDIAKKRDEQLNKHGKSVMSDYFTHENGELLDAATSLLLHGCLAQGAKGVEKIDSTDSRPATFEKNQWAKMLAKPDIERLAIAGALIAAEIDRIKQVRQDLNLPTS